MAARLAQELRQEYSTQLDTSGSIGKRYARADEIGTPWCLTVDALCATDQSVTLRDRDTMAQIRLPLSAVAPWVERHLKASRAFQTLSFAL